MSFFDYKIYKAKGVITMSQKNEFMVQKDYNKNLKRIILETVLTSIGAGFSVSIITVFWNLIGMDQAAIGFVQMIFTISVCFLDLPMGYIADRFSRKILNIIGDMGVAFVFVLYAFAQNIYVVLIAEILLGVFTAMTNGVDQSFIKFNCDKIDETGNLFKRVNIKVHTARYITLFAVAIIGGFIAKYSIRLCIGLSFIPYFLGGLIAINIKDFNTNMKAKHKNPVKDMVFMVKELLKEKKIRSILISYIFGKEITHSQIWVFTPLLLMVGVPIEIVSMGWILNYLMQILGGKISEKMINLKTSKKFIIPISIEIFWMLILIMKVNIITVWLFALNGFVQGLIGGNMATSLQESTKDEIQTSVMSVASTGCRLLYIPLVYIINYLGNINLKFALIGVCTIFFPLCLLSYINLKNIETT